MSDFDRTAEYAAHHSEADGVKVRKTIWAIFWVLLVVTSIEVSLGLVWSDLDLPWQLVKWTFIILTLVKAYYIVAYYMHLKDEYKNFKMIVAIPYIVLAVYFLILILIEAMYLNEEVDHLLM